jgi:hypothetical protein
MEAEDLSTTSAGSGVRVNWDRLGEGKSSGAPDEKQVLVFNGWRGGPRPLPSRTMVATVYPDGYVLVTNLYSEVAKRRRAA